jgi:hypothetical protein
MDQDKHDNPSSISHVNYRYYHCLIGMRCAGPIAASHSQLNARSERLRLVGARKAEAISGHADSQKKGTLKKCAGKSVEEHSAQVRGMFARSLRIKTSLITRSFSSSSRVFAAVPPIMEVRVLPLWALYGCADAMLDSAETAEGGRS